MAYEFRLPDIGEGLHEAEILQWFVKVGDVVAKDQPVVEVQTDKAAVEIATPVGGTVLRLGGDAGGIVKVGEILIAVATADQVETTGVIGAATTDKKVLAAPAVRKLARELGVDLTQVQPSDSRGHVAKMDVEEFAKRGRKEVPTMQPAPSLAKSPVSVPVVPLGVPPAESRFSQLIDYAEDGERRQPINGLRKRIYDHMTQSLAAVAQATAFDEMDVTRVVDMRERLVPFAKRQSIKLTYMAFFIKGITLVLKEAPIFNAIVDERKLEIVYKKEINIGVATATADGLLVPVIRNADQKSVFTLAHELEDLAQRARDRKLLSAELSDSTFTISSTGAKGPSFATPILNYPEVAILGVHKIAKKPVVMPDDSIVPRHMMGISLTFDHRIIDGEPVGQFMYRFKEIMENPELLMVL